MPYGTPVTSNDSKYELIVSDDDTGLHFAVHVGALSPGAETDADKDSLFQRLIDLFAGESGYTLTGPGWKRSPYITEATPTS